MNILRSVLAATLMVASALLVACSSDSDDNPPDPEDAGFVVPEAGPPLDGGVLSVCPEPGNFPNDTPECSAAADCEEDQQPLSNCEFCRPYNNSICSLGLCTNPARLEPDEGVLLRFSIVGLQSEIETFAGVGVAAETTGGETISCEDVYGSEWDLTESCYNWIDSRFTQISNMEPADAYPIRFGRFPGGRKVLLIVYGFDNDGAEGDPIGVSCTEVDVPEAGTRDMDLQETGDTMRRIQ